VPVAQGVRLQRRLVEVAGGWWLRKVFRAVDEVGSAFVAAEGELAASPPERLPCLQQAPHTAVRVYKFFVMFLRWPGNSAHAPASDICQWDDTRAIDVHVDERETLRTLTIAGTAGPAVSERHRVQAGQPTLSREVARDTS